MFPDWITPEQAAQLDAHYQLLVLWNRKLNLARIGSRTEAIERHYNESLFLARHLPPEPLKVADIGSGAGLPGLPVAIVRPDCFVTLMESRQKKAAFLREASRNLKNVAVFAGRAEESDAVFDWAISRAVSYEDLRPLLAVPDGLAPHVALLTGAEEPRGSRGFLGFDWEAPLLLPGSRQRFLRIGHRKCFT